MPGEPRTLLQDWNRSLTNPRRPAATPHLSRVKIRCMQPNPAPAAPLPPSPYREYLPPEDLSANVECFWVADPLSLSGEGQRVYPDGCMDFLFWLDRGRGELLGAMTHAKTVLPGLGRLIGIRFRPGGAWPLLSLPMHEMTDASTSLGELGFPSSLAEELAELPSEGARIRRLIDFLRSLLQQARKADSAVMTAIAILRQTQGRVNVQDLSASTGISRQHLRRKCLEYTGVSPKVLARVSRLQAVLERAAHEPTATWARLALDTGYSDQAHLCNEFRALTGGTPEQYRQLQTG